MLGVMLGLYRVGISPRMEKYMEKRMANEMGSWV